MTTDANSATESATAATAMILSDLAEPDHKAVVVDSPPGAGKSTLVVSAAGHLVECKIIVGTSAKWATVQDCKFGWAILDESYQMRSDMLLQIVERFDRGLFVGDPGQLDPFTIVGTERWIGLSHDPTQNGVTVMLEHNPTVPVRQLPVSWRLPTTAAPIISEAFYPFTEFAAGTEEGTRSLEFQTAGLGNTDLDETLAMAFTTGWALHELPRRHVPRTDAETIQTAAHLASRLLDRGAVATCERHRDGRVLRASDIAIGVAHRDQADLVRTALARTGNLRSGENL
ncbi:hypothetical protein AB0L63_32240 [Nocardia sp. NPDC051990]|uniref:hypothetical protein n=1 Tax=Nocardia sp. NPDC051990 TaxID=3155285 RepID=UPI003440B407